MFDELKSLQGVSAVHSEQRYEIRKKIMLGKSRLKKNGLVKV